MIKQKLLIFLTLLFPIWGEESIDLDRKLYIHLLPTFNFSELYYSLNEQVRYEEALKTKGEVYNNPLRSQFVLWGFDYFFLKHTALSVKLGYFEMPIYFDSEEQCLAITESEFECQDKYNYGSYSFPAVTGVVLTTGMRSKIFSKKHSNKTGSLIFLDYGLLVTQLGVDSSFDDEFGSSGLSTGFGPYAGLHYAFDLGLDDKDIFDVLFTIGVEVRYIPMDFPGLGGKMQEWQVLVPISFPLGSRIQKRGSNIQNDE